MLTSISSVRTSNSMIVWSCGGAMAMAVLPRELSPANAVVFQWKFVVFSKGMSDPIFGGEDAPQIGVPAKEHPGKIEYLALVPLCRFPDVGNGRHFGQLPGLVV